MEPVVTLHHFSHPAWVGPDLWLSDERVGLFLLFVARIVPALNNGLMEAGEQPVRAGQRIWAQGGDLIVTSTVNAGGEVIADGNIHVYGALRGRAIAGGGNNAEARVFAQNFDPELISIAGYYAVRDGLQGAPIGKAVQVRLTGERMRFDPIG